MSTTCSQEINGVKEVQKLTGKAAQVRRKLKGLTSRRAYSSLDTEFGILTVADAAAEPPARRSRQRAKSKR
jgi:predicted  nucleic acid-binding Zn-ribbon protein